jgi:hypothetical protein
MARHRTQHRKELSELLAQRPGWRLEPQSTPGVAPLWCYTDGDRPEFSVSALEDGVLLRELSSEQEIRFADVEALASWLRTHRADTLREVPARPGGRARFRRFFEWS